MRGSEGSLPEKQPPAGLASRTRPPPLPSQAPGAHARPLSSDEEAEALGGRAAPGSLRGLLLHLAGWSPGGVLSRTLCSCLSGGGWARPPARVHLEPGALVAVGASGELMQACWSDWPWVREVRGGPRGGRLFWKAGRASAPRPGPPGPVPLGASSPPFCPVVPPPQGSVASPRPGPPPPSLGPSCSRGHNPMVTFRWPLSSGPHVPGSACPGQLRPQRPGLPVLPLPPSCLPGEFVARTLPTAETWESAQTPYLIYF